jgi:hypothetical protein
MDNQQPLPSQFKIGGENSQTPFIYKEELLAAVPFDLNPFISRSSGVRYSFKRYRNVAQNQTKYYIPIIYQLESLDSHIYYIDYTDIVSFLTYEKSMGRPYDIFPPLYQSSDSTYSLQSMLELAKIGQHLIMRSDCISMLIGMEDASSRGIKMLTVVTADKIISKDGKQYFNRESMFFKDLAPIDIQNVDLKIQTSLGMSITDKSTGKLVQPTPIPWNTIKPAVTTSGKVQLKHIKTPQISASLISGIGCLKHFDRFVNIPTPDELKALVPSTPVVQIPQTPQTPQTPSGYHNVPEFNTATVIPTVPLSDEITGRIITFMTKENCDKNNLSAKHRLDSAMIKIIGEFSKQLERSKYFTLTTCCYGQATGYLKADLGTVFPNNSYSLKLAMRHEDMNKILTGVSDTTKLTGAGNEGALIYSVFHYISVLITQHIGNFNMQSESTISKLSGNILASLPSSNYLESSNNTIGTDDSQNIAGLIAYIKPMRHHGRPIYNINALMGKKNNLIIADPEQMAGQKKTYDVLVQSLQTPYPKPKAYSYPADMSAIKEITNIINTDGTETWIPVQDVPRAKLSNRAAVPPRYDVALLTRKILSEQTQFEVTNSGVHISNNDGNSDNEMSGDEGNRFESDFMI